MQIQGTSQTWTIQSPLTLELDVTRAIYSACADGVFRIYNLNASTRKDIYSDWYSQYDTRTITVRAGYRSWATVYGPPNPDGVQNLQSLPLIFQGNIFQAYSQREGASWVTTVSAFDGGNAVTTGDVNISLDAGTSTTQQFRVLIAALGPSISEGYIDPTLQADNITGVSFVGSPWQKIQQMAKSLYASAFIDLGKVYIFGNNSIIPNLTGGLSIISAATGLLDTPIKQKTLISFPIMFEPRLKVGQQVILQSIETVNNGTYSVIGVDHVGTISDTVAGDLRTRVTCNYPFALVPHGAIQ